MSSFLGSAVTRIESVERQGSVNWTFCVTVGSTRYAVRINRARSIADAFAEYSKERWFMDAARACDIPTPAVLDVGQSESGAWTVQEWIDGTSATDDRATYRTLGEYARRLAQHAPRPPHALVPDANDNWREQVRYNLDELSTPDRLLGLQVYSQRDLPALREALAQLAQDRPSVGLDHGDLWPRNLMRRADGSLVLLDWGCATIDVVPLAPLSRIFTERVLHPSPHDDSLWAFAEGFGLTTIEAAAMETTVRAWALLKAFDLVRWAMDRCPARVDDTSVRARELMRALRPALG